MKKPAIISIVALMLCAACNDTNQAQVTNSTLEKAQNEKKVQEVLNIFHSCLKKFPDKKGTTYKLQKCLEPAQIEISTELGYSPDVARKVNSKNLKLAAEYDAGKISKEERAAGIQESTDEAAVEMTNRRAQLNMMRANIINQQAQANASAWQSISQGLVSTQAPVTQVPPVHFDSSPNIYCDSYQNGSYGTTNCHRQY